MSRPDRHRSNATGIYLFVNRRSVRDRLLQREVYEKMGMDGEACDALERTCRACEPVACEQAGVVPDIMTLSKALTGGTLALAVTGGMILSCLTMAWTPAAWALAIAFSASSTLPSCSSTEAASTWQSMSDASSQPAFA